MPEKKLYNIFHIYDTDRGFGDAITQSDLVGTVYATPDEIAEFLARWDKPEIYDEPYAPLHHHHVIAEEVTIATVTGLIPYPEYHDLWDDFVIEEEEGE